MFPRTNVAENLSGKHNPNTVMLVSTLDFYTQRASLKINFKCSDYNTSCCSASCDAVLIFKEDCGDEIKMFTHKWASIGTCMYTSAHWGG